MLSFVVTSLKKLKASKVVTAQVSIHHTQRGNMSSGQLLEGEMTHNQNTGIIKVKESESEDLTLKTSKGLTKILEMDEMMSQVTYLIRYDPLNP